MEVSTFLLTGIYSEKNGRVKNTVDDLHLFMLELSDLLLVPGL